MFNPAADRDIFDGVPPHRSGSTRPAGANHVFADGSTRWIKADELRFLHSWNTGNRLCYFFQERQDMPPNLVSALDNANMKINP
jgi:hypothetical protein